MNLHKQNRGAASRSILVVAAALLAAGAGLWFGTHRFGPAAQPSAAPTPMLAGLKDQMRSVRLITPPRALPDWQLRLSDGGTATSATLQGRWTLVFLGFTHCPDVCPTTLAELSKSQKLWEALPEAKRPRLLFVTVDPERDTPQLVGEFAHYFHPETMAASPTPEQLAFFAKTLGLVYMKVSEPDGSYSMDHSATLVLLDPQGRQAGLLSPPLDPQKIADDLRLLAERAP